MRGGAVPSSTICIFKWGPQSEAAVPGDPQRISATRPRLPPAAQGGSHPAPVSHTPSHEVGPPSRADPPQLPPHSPPKASRAPQAAQSRSRAVRATSRQALPREPRRETETTHGVGGGGGGKENDPAPGLEELQPNSPSAPAAARRPLTPFPSAPRPHPSHVRNGAVTPHRSRAEGRWESSPDSESPPLPEQSSSEGF